MVIKKKMLISAIERIVSLTAKNSTMPITRCMAIVSKDGLLEFRATNLDTVAVSFADIDVGEFITCVDCYMFLGIIKTLGESIELISHENQLTIKSDSFSSTIRTYDLSDFPSIEEKYCGNQIEWKTIKNCLNKSLDYVSTDQARGVLCGVLLNANEGCLKIAATSGSVLYAYEDKAQLNGLHGVLTTEFIKLILQTPEENKNVFFNVADGKSIFKTADFYCEAKTIQGFYPKYENVIPREFLYKCEIARESLVVALNQSLAIANSKSLFAKLHINNDLLSIIIDRKNEGLSSTNTIKCVSNCSNFEIGVNIRSIKDILNLISDKNILINLNSSVGAGVIFSGNETFLFMPLRLVEEN